MCYLSCPFLSGRNEKGQLGLGHLNRVDKPTLVDCLAGCNVIAASCGRNHTLFLTGKWTLHLCRFCSGPQAPGVKTCLLGTKFQKNQELVCWNNSNLVSIKQGCRSFDPRDLKKKTLNLTTRILAEGS